MKILVLNGSPKGERSTTLQTVRYLQVLHPEHQFLELPVGQRIKRYEKDFSTPREALSQAEVILFCYPVYTFLVPGWRNVLGKEWFLSPVVGRRTSLSFI